MCIYVCVCSHYRLWMNIMYMYLSLQKPQTTESWSHLGTAWPPLEDDSLILCVYVCLVDEWCTCIYTMYLFLQKSQALGSGTPLPKSNLSRSHSSFQVVCVRVCVCLFYWMLHVRKSQCFCTCRSLKIHPVPLLGYHCRLVRCVCCYGWVRYIHNVSVPAEVSSFKKCNSTSKKWPF